MIRDDKSARKTLTPKGAATREKLLTTAKQIFEQGNYHEGSVSEICRRAWVANGTFYQYFKDKEAVLLELAARLSEALRTKLETALHMDGDLEARLLRGLSVFISFIRQNRDSTRFSARSNSSTSERILSSTTD
jgi:AcrR family transcriptional regulator